MTYLTILEKLQVLLNLIMDYKIVLFEVVMMLIFTFIYLIKKINKRKYFLLMSSSLLITFIISIVSNHKILADTFDNFTTIFFSNIYFPSIYVYIAVLTIISIAFVITILNKRLSKVYKIINSFEFILNSILFIIVLNIIAKNKIDIFSSSSLYTDINLVAILELSMNLFILWVLSLTVVYVTECICLRIKVRKNTKIEVNNAVIKEEVKDFSEDNSTVNLNSNINNILDFNDSGNTIDSHNKEKIVADIKEESAVNSLNTLKPVYYKDETPIESHSIIDPQKILEEKYDEIKNATLQDIMESALNDDIKVGKEIKLQDVVEDISPNDIPTDRKNNILEKLKVNTVSLNDLSKEIIEKENSTNTNIESNIKTIKDDMEYTTEDYKKFIKMLKQIKIHSKSNSISVDDAIAISLISNYSYDDCVKFKKILESNIN